MYMQESFESGNAVLDGIKQKIKSYTDNRIPICALAEIMSMDYRTIMKRAGKISLLISVGRFKFVDRETAVQIADREKLRFSGLKCLGEIVPHPGERKTLIHLLERGEVEGEKDASGMWGVKETDVEKIKEMIKVIREGIVVRDGIKYYSISKASNNAAALLAKPGTEMYRTERNRLNKRFQRQVYEKRIGQQIFDGKYYVTEPVYRAMIDPESLKKGLRTNFEGIKLSRDADEKVLLRGKKLEKKVTIEPVKSVGIAPPFQAKPYLTTGELKERYPPVQYFPIAQPEDEIKLPPQADKNVPCLYYDADKLPLLRKCTKGRTISFDGMLGIIVGYNVEDKFRPQIVVQFPGEKKKVFQHLNLIAKVR